MSTNRMLLVLQFIRLLFSGPTTPFHTGIQGLA